MTHFEQLHEEIQNGLEGKNSSIPTGFHRFDRFVSIRKRIYSLIFGGTGCGKTGFVHNAYILNPFDWWMQNKRNTNATLKPILFSMERSKLYTLSKWVSRKIFLEEGINVPVGKMLGWWDIKLTHDEHDLIKMNEDYVNELCEFVDIYEGNRSAADIFRILKQYAEQNGVEEQVSEHKKVYIPNKPNEIVMPIVDHMGLIKRTKDTPVKKEAIDKVSEHMQYFRDFHGYSPVVVSQVNRDISNPIYQKMDSFEPNLDQIKESGRPAEDSDCVISLFQPSRYKTTDKTYNVSKFINPENGADCFRKISILKNTYGEADVGIGMAFMGSTGMFKELVSPREYKNMDDEQLNNFYNSILDYKYFLK